MYIIHFRSRLPSDGLYIFISIFTGTAVFNLLVWYISITKQSSFYNMLGRSMATAYSYYHNKHLYDHVKCTCELHGLCLTQLFITFARLPPS